MKTTTLILAAIFMLSLNFYNPNGSFTDSRDGQKYPTITIGGKTWLGENLRYKVEGSLLNPDNPNPRYGRAYTWEQAQKACPEAQGWRLPTHEEFTAMEKAIGGDNLSTAMRSEFGWANDANGTNSSGFNAYPAATYNEKFDRLGYGASFWTATEATNPYSKTNNTAWMHSIGLELKYAHHGRVNKSLGLACRCIQN